jgi:peptidoglycan/LPS O-acetylase OafA/YrhL
MNSARTIDLGSQRDVPLEALRGIAAIVVVAWHFTLSFFPTMVDAAHCTLCETPLFAFMHGTAAVGVFFALSGYVLTRRYFETGERRILVIGALKRWFRLFLPVFLSVILSWLLFATNSYSYEKAGMLSRSGWLVSFGYAMRTPFDPTFWMALKDGFTEAFYHDEQSLNPILWTIHLELIGSFTAFAFAALIGHLRNYRWLVFVTSAIVMVPIHFIDPALAPFVPGCLLAFYSPKHNSVNLPVALIMIAVGLCCIGYREPVGFYSMFNFPGFMNSDTQVNYNSTIGAILIMIALIGCAPIRKALSGRIAQVLGRLSFPIYLVHMILICSVGSMVYAAVYKDGNEMQAALAAAAALIPAILIIAGLFAVIDVKWIAFVNGKFRKIKIS